MQPRNEETEKSDAPTQARNDEQYIIQDGDDGYQRKISRYAGALLIGYIQKWKYARLEQTVRPKEKDLNQEDQDEIKTKTPDADQETEEKSTMRYRTSRMI